LGLGFVLFYRQDPQTNAPVTAVGTACSSSILTEEEIHASLALLPLRFTPHFACVCFVLHEIKYPSELLARI
jgi:hypothetical protein